MADDTQLQGTSNPPNGGNITDVDNPEANDATVPQTAVATNQPPQNNPAQDAAATKTPTPQTPQANQTPGQPQDQSALPKQPNLPKAPAQPAGPVAPASSPAVQKANTFHDVAETLAGGPRYKYDVDAYGNTTKTKIPVSNTHLALAIAMEALTGGITGLANGQGPNGASRGAAAAMQQSAAQVQNQDKQAREQAQQDFAHRAQVTETNMRLYANARNIGRQDAEDTDKYLAQYKPLVDQLQKEYPGMIKGVVKYGDLAKYNATSETAIPYARVPRLDNNGKQVSDAKGIPQWDIDYMILDPKFKAQFEPTDEDRKNYKEMTGQDLPEMTGSTAMNASLWLNKKSQLTQWGVAKTNFNNFNDTLDKATEENGGTTSTADLTKEGTLNSPVVKNKEVADIANSVTDKIAPQVKDVVTPDNFKALINGIINQESGGDPNAVSPTGATGVMQLTQGTAKLMGVADRTNPQQNVTGGTQYFAQLLSKYKDPKLALAAYYSGPGAIQNGKIVDTQLHTAADTTNYANKISNNVGLETVTPVPEKEKPEHPDMAAFSQSHPTFPSAVEKFNASLAHTDGSYGAALKDMESKGFQDDSNIIQAFLGGAQNIKTHDDYVQTQAKEREAQVQTDAQEERANAKEKQKQESDTAAYDTRQQKIGSLLSAEIPQNSLDMSDKELTENLAAQGVTVPPSALIDAKAIARYEAPLSSVSNKKWYKDQGFTQDEMVSIVKQLNPAYNATNYDNLGKYVNPNSTSMKTITASAGAVNHLNMLLDAAQEVKNRGNGSGQFPILNRLAGEFGKNVGNADYQTLQALTRAVNGELGKTLAGGFAPDKSEVDALANNMTADNSLNQIQQLGKLYTGILHGKIAPIDEEYFQGTDNRRHIKTIPDSTNKLFRRMGYDTPWDVEGQKAQQVQQNQQQQMQQQLQSQGFVGMSQDGKTAIKKDGTRVPNPFYNQPSAQPATPPNRLSFNNTFGQ